MRPPLRTDDPDADAPDSPSSASSPAAAGDPSSTNLITSDQFGSVDGTSEHAYTLTAPIENPFGLKAQQLLFADRYLATFNATQAYLQAGYRGGASDAARLLRSPRMQATIQAKLATVMGGEEALARLSIYARFDVRKLFPKDERFQNLPDDVALCVKAVTQTKHGLRIEVHDAMHASEIMAKVSGRLKETVKVEHTLEDILARSWEAPKERAS